MGLSWDDNNMAEKSTEPPTDHPSLLDKASSPTSLSAEMRQQLFPNYPDDAQISRFFDSLGRAITVWQNVEMSLHEIYQRTIAPAVPGAESAAFHAITSFNTKVGMVNAAISFRFFDKPLILGEWGKIRDDATEKARRRNQFVHFVTYIMFDEKRPEDRLRLEPHLGDTRFQGRDKPRLRMSEVAAITDRFDVLAKRMMRFAARIARLPISS